MHAQREKDVKAQQSEPAMKMQEYINALKTVDFKTTGSISTFMSKTQIRDWQPYPQPVILGSENGIIYQLGSQIVNDIEPKDELPESTPPSDFIIEIRPTDPKATSPVKYVYPLGRLEAVYQTGDLAQTPFRVCINPVDRSIWLVMAPYNLDGVGEKDSIPANEDTWPYFLTKANGRTQFDVMQVASWKDFIALNQTSAISRVFFNAQALATAKRIQPKAYVPAASVVQQALGGAGQAA
ncbi:hypothetical protein P7C71_g2164, partial [Lecanoromycetidae sp. Uapishka_2]